MSSLNRYMRAIPRPAERRADRVERLPQAECLASLLWRRHVGDQRIAGRAPDAFADAIEEPGDEHEPDQWQAGTAW